MTLVFGRTSTGLLVPLRVDTTGRVEVGVLPSIPAGTNLIGSVGVEGYYNAGWRNQPLQFGVSGQVIERYQNTNLPAGTTSYDFPTVPANRIWVITVMTCWVAGSPPTLVFMNLIHTASTYHIIRQPSPVGSTIYSFYGNLVLFPGDNIRGGVTGAAANDDLYMNISGYYFSTNL